MRVCQLRTVDPESADDRLTSATEKTTPTLSQYHRVSRWQALLIRTKNAQCHRERIDNGTPAVLSARAHLIDVIFGDFYRLFLRIRTGKTLASVLQMTVSTNCTGSR